MSYYFEGWYFKHQNAKDTIAFIPGFTRDKAFIQVVTNDASYFFPFRLAECHQGDNIRIGDNSFSPKGISIRLHHGNNHIEGHLEYRELSPIRNDIMGPFRFLPMQCRHGIISMSHRLKGSIFLDGREFNFNDGLGYIETDSGRSFPKSYAWIQSNDFPEKCSIMMAIADIPFLKTHFQGLICVIMYKGFEYRLATYNGAEIIFCSKTLIIIRHRKYRLDIHIAEQDGHKLAAPQRGQMSRMIKENPSCRARFKFSHDGKVIFDMKSRQTSFEYVE